MHAACSHMNVQALTHMHAQLHMLISMHARCRAQLWPGEWIAWNYSIVSCPPCTRLPHQRARLVLSGLGSYNLVLHSQCMVPATKSREDPNAILFLLPPQIRASLKEDFLTEALLNCFTGAHVWWILSAFLSIRSVVREYPLFLIGPRDTWWILGSFLSWENPGLLASLHWATGNLLCPASGSITLPIPGCLPDLSPSSFSHLPCVSQLPFSAWLVTWSCPDPLPVHRWSPNSLSTLSYQWFRSLFHGRDCCLQGCVVF